MSSSTGSGHPEDFGWELLLRTVESDVKSKEDMLLVMVHWQLTKRGFGCLEADSDVKAESDTSGASAGSEQTSPGTQWVRRETLPKGWNNWENSTLKYTYENKIYNLVKMRCGDNVVFNLVNTSDLSTSNVTLSVDSVNNLNGPLETVFADYKEVIHKIKSQLIEVVEQKAAKGTQTQSESGTSENFQPRNMDPFRNPLMAIPPFRSPLLEVGRSDLHPFGGSGGMLFDPFHDRGRPNPGIGALGGLPPFSVPPGARFDPIGPGNPTAPFRRPYHPDSDELPPPGNDHMFM